MQNLTVYVCFCSCNKEIKPAGNIAKSLLIVAFLLGCTFAGEKEGQAPALKFRYGTDFPPPSTGPDRVFVEIYTPDERTERHSERFFASSTQYLGVWGGGGGKGHNLINMDKKT